jgi:hypothetical protein
MLADLVPASKLVRFTLRGRMVRYTSNLRRQRAQIFAFTLGKEVYRQLAPVLENFSRPHRLRQKRGRQDCVGAGTNWLRLVTTW